MKMPSGHFCGIRLKSDLVSEFAFIESLYLPNLVRVRPDSAAAKAGLQQQDVIIAVDGQSATTLTVSKLRKMFRVEGREYLLRVKRGEEMLEIKIKLKRLI